MYTIPMDKRSAWCRKYKIWFDKRKTPETPHSVVFQNSKSVYCKGMKSLDKYDTRSIRLCSGLAQRQLVAKACVPTARLSRIERDVEGPF